METDSHRVHQDTNLVTHFFREPLPNVPQCPTATSLPEQNPRCPSFYSKHGVSLFAAFVTRVTFCFGRISSLVWWIASTPRTAVLGPNSEQQLTPSPPSTPRSASPFLPRPRRLPCPGCRSRTRGDELGKQEQVEGPGQEESPAGTATGVARPGPLALLLSQVQSEQREQT